MQRFWSLCHTPFFFPFCLCVFFLSFSEYFALFALLVECVGVEEGENEKI